MMHLDGAEALHLLVEHITETGDMSKHGWL
jgi:hypothetical protein